MMSFREKNVRSAHAEQNAHLHQAQERGAGRTLAEEHCEARALRSSRLASRLETCEGPFTKLCTFERCRRKSRKQYSAAVVVQVDEATHLILRVFVPAPCSLLCSWLPFES